MKALVVPNQNATTISQLEVTEVTVPDISADEILIKLHAVGLNPVDFKLVAGHHPNWTYPHVLGLDAAGEVVKVGRNNPKNFQVGEKVFYHGDLSKDGCFAEYAKANYHYVARIPNGVSYSEAASVLCNGMTAYAAIHRKMNLTGKKSILIHAGAGGVGSTAIQLAKLAGLTVITTVSTHKVDWVKQLSPDLIIDYKTEDTTQKVADFTNNVGVDLIVNTVGPEEAQKDLERLAYNGALITIVGEPKMDNYDLSAMGQSILSVNLGGAHQHNNQPQIDDLATMASELGQLLADKKLKSIITKTIPFSKIANGLQDLIDRKISGKIIATFDD
ncbi:zinc-binding dehydrogenase [Companilactobacillus zhongbaensis]|uniref:zinc-binding dehydrogenase n=1 Tax=Companilactobacillus zhongbaensis TaxID=2486009 RepID=UPI000F78E1CE|nr:zinc-binding dehydrogenase [Companilactobacillus zhongbaensis]